MVKHIPYDKDDPDRVERWIDWLNSPYWDERTRGVSASTVQDELEAFAAAAD